MYPGVLARLEGMGPGEYVFDGQSRKGVKGTQVVECMLAVRWAFSDMPLMVRMASSFRQRTPGLLDDRFHYAFHCGPSKNDVKDTYFRIDLDRTQAPHVHLAPNIEDHIPVENVDPDVVDIQPAAFLDLVEKFRNDIAAGIDPRIALPLRRKTP